MKIRISNHSRLASNRFRQRIDIVVLLMFVSLMSGCAEEAKIEVYEVPKSNSGLDRLKLTTGIPAAKPERSPDLPVSRMVVGMVLRPEATWTFKILGTKSVIDQAENEWKSFFAQLKFDEVGQPEFEVPQGWEDQGIRKGMFSNIRTLVIDSSTNSKMEISSLMAGQGIEMNVNRWRGQLGLAPATGKIDLPKIEIEGAEILLFDEVGQFRGRGGPVSAAGGPRKTSPQSGESNPSSGANTTTPSLEFDRPEGWETGKTSQIVVAKLRKKIAGSDCEITLSRMPAINEWPLNVGAWAASIGLDEPTPEQLKTETVELKVAGVAARKIVLRNTENNLALTGIMFKKQGFAWFAKLVGKTDNLNSAMVDFDLVVQSIQVTPAQ